jgi:hypothetical protein
MVNYATAGIEGLMKQMSDERKAAATNMTLGAFIDALAAVADPETPVVLRNGRGAHGFDSYRGYYEDLALNPQDTRKTVRDVLADARAALGEVFQGYKGGDFPMHKKSLLWVACYGSCGTKLTGVTLEGGHVVIETTPDDSV